MRRVPDVRRVERRLRDPPDREHPAAARELAGERQPCLDLRRVGRRFAVAVPGCVGTTFQRSTASASSSSASTRWTIVAVASPGGAPVSCRSDVNGMPETRAPR